MTNPTDEQVLEAAESVIIGAQFDERSKILARFAKDILSVDAGEAVRDAEQFIESSHGHQDRPITALLEARAHIADLLTLYRKLAADLENIMAQHLEAEKHCDELLDENRRLEEWKLQRDMLMANIEKHFGEDEGTLAFVDAVKLLEKPPAVGVTREEIVATIMACMRAPAERVEPRPSIEEIERSINSGEDAKFDIRGDGTVWTRPKALTTGDLADSILALLASKAPQEKEE